MDDLSFEFGFYLWALFVGVVCPALMVILLISM
jgi:hypothetical protein